MVLALRDVVRPAFGTVTVRVTVPVNPLTGAMLIAVVPEFPAWMVTDAGLVGIVTLGLDAVIVNVAVCVRERIVPVTVTVIVLLAEARHDRVDVPDIVRLEELGLHVNPVEADVY